MSGDLWGDVRGLIATVAPTVATALGGPLAGIAVQQLGRVLLGDEQADAAQVRDAARAMTADQLVALKTVEADFKARMAEAGIEMERIAAGDRDSARRRQVDMGDWTPSALGVVIMGGFFGILTLVLLSDLPEGTSDVVNVLLGALGGMCAQVGNYFFGSSRGSKNKDAVLADIGRGVRR